MTVRIAIQASDLDHARIDGTRVYLSELLRRFGDLAPSADFFLYHQQKFNPMLAPPDRPNYYPLSLPFPKAWMQTRFAWEIVRTKPDHLFLPIQAAPLFLSSELDVTATIHDLAFRQFPETFTRIQRCKLNLMLDTVVGRANRLITVSDATRQDLLTAYPSLDPKKVQVIHHGFDSIFFGKQLREEERKKEIGTWNLEGDDYILYVGALQPRKNLVRLITAFDKLRQKHPEAKLVLAGEVAWLSDDILAAQRQSRSRDHIILTGRVDFPSLRALYQGARFFAFPSLSEGFGLPILEAYASGIPVLTAKNSSLPEVAGKGALYVEALDSYDIAEKLMLLWNDEQLRRKLTLLGRQELNRFSWEKTARETLDVILNQPSDVNE